MIIIYTLVIFFGLMGVLLPFISDDLNPDYTTIRQDIDSITGEINDTGRANNAITGVPNFWDVLLSVFKMFFWTFGSVHWIIDLLVFTPLRILLGITIARNIWVGGGG